MRWNTSYVCVVVMHGQQTPFVWQPLQQLAGVLALHRFRLITFVEILKCESLLITNF